MRPAVTAVIGDFTRKPCRKKLVDEKPGNVGAAGGGEVGGERGHGSNIYRLQGAVFYGNRLHAMRAKAMDGETIEKFSKSQ